MIDLMPMNDISHSSSGRMPNQPRSLRLAINPDLIDKNQTGEKTLFAEGWHNVEVTPAELAAAINDGMAYCAQIKTRRKAENFLCSDILSVDIDGTRRIPEILADPFVARHLTILYTTPNHTDESHRFRLIFALDRTITAAPDTVSATLSLALKLNGDRSVKDAARLFYGSRGSNPQVFEGSIPVDVLDQLIAEGHLARQKDTFDNTAGPVTTVSRQTIDFALPVKIATGTTLPFRDITPGTSVMCPFHYDTDPSAFVVLSRNGTKGLHCSACAKTFWPPGGMPRHDFFDFDKRVREADAYFRRHEDGLHRYGAEEKIHPGLTHSNIHIFNERYLDIPELKAGLTLIKSPKGTGKTEVIGKLIRDKTRVLLIGHRVALIGQSCARLGLENYLDYTDGGLWQGRLGVCLDSLRRLVWREHHGPQPVSRQNEFDTIIIDESEQVLAHFLSNLIKDHERKAIFVLFRRLLKQAKHVIALDADLGWLTFETLTKLVNDEPGTENNSRYFKTKDGESNVRPCHVYLNEYTFPKRIEVFPTEEQLTDDLMQTIAEGRRVFVTANAKRRIDDLTAFLEDRKVKCIKVTSDTSQQKRVKHFIKNIRTEAVNYQAILTSPSMGTGVDIAFENQAEEIDTVYGFCQELITTHLDFDQQIARVRHPKHVKVWITPKRFGFDTAPDVIRKELQKRETYVSTLIDYDEHLRPVYHTDEPFLDLAALVVSHQRASKNHLKRHFLEAKVQQGGTVRSHDHDEKMYRSGVAHRLAARGLGLQARIDVIMAASTLREPDYEKILERLKDRDELSEEEFWAFHRTRIELFYRKKASEGLIGFDDMGRMRARIALYERLLRYQEILKYGGGENWYTKNPKSFGARFLKHKGRIPSLLHHLLTLTPIYRDGHILSNAPVTVHDLGDFAREAARLKTSIETDLDISLRSDFKTKPTRLLGDLVRSLGIPLGKPTRRRKDNVTTQVYVISQRDVDNIEEIIAARTSSSRWPTLYTINGWDPAQLTEDDWHDNDDDDQ